MYISDTGVTSHFVHFCVYVYMLHWAKWASQREMEKQVCTVYWPQLHNLRTSYLPTFDVLPQIRRHCVDLLSMYYHTHAHVASSYHVNSTVSEQDLPTHVQLCGSSRSAQRPASTQGTSLS